MSSLAEMEEAPDDQSLNPSSLFFSPTKMCLKSKKKTPVGAARLRSDDLLICLTDAVCII